MCRMVIIMSCYLCQWVGGERRRMNAITTKSSISKLDERCQPRRHQGSLKTAQAYRNKPVRQIDVPALSLFCHVYVGVQFEGKPALSADLRRLGAAGVGKYSDWVDYLPLGDTSNSQDGMHSMPELSSAAYTTPRIDPIGTRRLCVFGLRCERSKVWR